VAWQLVEAVLEDHPALPERQFRVLVALAHAAPITSRRAGPGLAVLGHRADCHQRTARRALDALEATGLIKPVGGHGPQHPQVYELTGVQPHWANGETGDTQTPPVGTGDTQASGVARTGDTQWGAPLQKTDLWGLL